MENITALRLWSHYFVNPKSFDISNNQSVFSKAHRLQGQELADKTLKKTLVLDVGEGRCLF